MGFSFRKSIKLGPARINLSKSGVGYSIGAGGVRYTKSPKRRSKKKSSSKSSAGCLPEIIKWTGIICVLGLCLYVLEHYWAWILGAAVLIAAGFIGYKIYKSKKAHVEETSEPETAEDDNPVP